MFATYFTTFTGFLRCVQSEIPILFAHWRAKVSGAMTMRLQTRKCGERLWLKFPEMKRVSSMRRFWVVGAVIWLVLSSAVAKATEPTALIKTLADEAIAILGDSSMDEAARRPKLENLFREAMDLAFVGRFSVGRYWRQMTPAQKQSYQSAFEQYVLNVYAGRLREYSGESFVVSGSREVDERDTIVLSQLVRTSRAPVEIEWRVRRNGEQAKVIDVSVEGVSMALTQRQEFGSILQREGADGLIKRLTTPRGDPGPPR